MKVYLDLIKTVLNEGEWKNNRTGIKALTVPGAIIRHDLSQGFPLLTTKKMAFKSIKVELEGFIKGITDKSWYQERGCTIWDEWCNPQKILPGMEREEREKFQKEEKDLGKIYGYQWRNFFGVDQLKQVINTLKQNPDDRRMLVSAWNPAQLNEMALPPCHVLFHLIVTGGRLHLTWFQRSCDLGLGIPFNLASYALLLHLLVQEANLNEGIVTGMLSDVHIYENHLDGIREQLTREPYPLPKIITDQFTSILEWKHGDTVLQNYQYHSPISLPIAV